MPGISNVTVCQPETKFDRLQQEVNAFLKWYFFFFIFKWKQTFRVLENTSYHRAKQQKYR